MPHTIARNAGMRQYIIRNSIISSSRRGCGEVVILRSLQDFQARGKVGFWTFPRSVFSTARGAAFWVEGRASPWAG